MLGQLPLKYFYLGLVLILIAVLYTGILIGRTSLRLSNPSSICAVNSDFKSDSLSTLSIQEINPQSLKGRVEGGNLRIIVNEEVLEVSAPADFQFNTGAIFKDLMASLPKDAQFFASKRGTNYYPIREEKVLKNLNPENLIFFKSAEEAEKAGYKR